MGRVCRSKQTVLQKRAMSSSDMYKAFGERKRVMKREIDEERERVMKRERERVGSPERRRDAVG